MEIGDFDKIQNLTTKMKHYRKCILIKSDHKSLFIHIKLSIFEIHIQSLDILSKNRIFVLLAVKKNLKGKIGLKKMSLYETTKGVLFLLSMLLLLIMPDFEKKFFKIQFC
jgi:hypothetical protein